MPGEAAFEEIVLCLVDHDQYQAKLDPELPAIAALSGSVRALEKLHRIGADGNKPDVYGWTPLALTKLLQKTDVVRYLNHQTAWAGTIPNAWMPYAAIKVSFKVFENDLNIIQKTGLQCSISTGRPLPVGLDRYHFEVTSRKLAGD